MNGTHSLKTPAVAIAIGIALCTIFLAQRSIADTTCPMIGERLTVSSDAVVQTGQLPVGVCYNPNAVGINQTSELAKRDLQSMACNSGINIQNLDANFAVCADKFMQQLRQVSSGACVNAAYRNPQQQLAACIRICGASSCPGRCAAPGSSFHQRGLAIDVSYKISNPQAWQIANISTTGGVANPTGLHTSDPAHFQATGSSCSGSPVPASDTTDIYTGAQIGPMQSMFGSPQLASLPIANTPQPLTQPAPVTQSTATPNQTPLTTPTLTPTAPLTTIATSAASSILSNLFHTAPLPFMSTATSAAQALNILTNLGSFATSGSMLLNPNLTSVINTLIPGSATAGTQAGVSAVQSVPYSQDTFSSGSTQYSPTYTSGLDQILEPLKRALLDLLPFLQSL